MTDDDLRRSTDHAGEPRIAAHLDRLQVEREKKERDALRAHLDAAIDAADRHQLDLARTHARQAAGRSHTPPAEAAFFVTVTTDGQVQVHDADPEPDLSHLLAVVEELNKRVREHFEWCPPGLCHCTVARFMARSELAATARRITAESGDR